MSGAGEWCLIESDPGVFTALIKDFGVEGVQVEEIFSLDDDSFADIEPVHGLIFLFKYVEDESPAGKIVEDGMLDEIFFAKQVITNACATQAIVSVLLNTRHPDVNLGSTLQDLKDFTCNFDSSMKGLALSNSSVIRQVHNSFARQQVFEYDEKQAKSDEAFHFIGYVPMFGQLYELDGLKPAPIDHGKITTSTWLQYVRPVIEKRMAKYTAGEIRFNLMALVGDRKIALEKKILNLQSSLSTVNDETVANGIRSKIMDCQDVMKKEEEKRRSFKVENIRRKHNYLPFIVEMLRVLASDNKLMPLIDEAKEKLATKAANKSK